MIPLAGSAYTYAYAALGELLAWIIGWDLTLEYAMGASTVSSGWSNHFVEILAAFHMRMPLWLAYDHWTALTTAENVVARNMAHASDPSLINGSQAFLDRVAQIISAQSPELLQRAHDLVAAPHIFGVEIGFNLPAFVIALIITAVLVVGIKESANFNATIVVIKVGVVLFVILAGHEVRRARQRRLQLGGDSRRWESRALAKARPTFSSPTSDLTRYRPRRRKPRIHNATCPSASSHRSYPARILYIIVAFVLTGMVPWKAINIEAPLAVAFLDRGLEDGLHRDHRSVLSPASPA